jgi:galactokinase
MSLESVAGHSAEFFAKCFGRGPRWMVAAPGRVNLIGEHTDYNDGFVLPMAIERYMVAAADRNANRHVTLHSITTGETATFNLRPRVERGEPGWSNYVRGVVAGFQQRGARIGGFDVVINSTLPYGGGLASSAALEVVTATLLEAITGVTLDPVEKALLCQRAEHDFAGVPCGIMDQFTSALAQADHALLLDCRTRRATPVPMKDPQVTVLILNTHIRHKLADGEYAQRKSECETAARVLKCRSLRDATLQSLNHARRLMDPVVFRRARHVISENDRTLQAARALQDGAWQQMGRLMYASHDSLRDDYEVSCAELDAIVEIAKAIPEKDGMIGCRMTGAGFGGCAVCLVRTDAVRHITRKIEEAYEKRTGSNVEIFGSRPAAGTRVLNWAPPRQKGKRAAKSSH